MKSASLIQPKKCVSLCVQGNVFCFDCAICCILYSALRESGDALSLPTKALHAITKIMTISKLKMGQFCIIISRLSLDFWSVLVSIILLIAVFLWFSDGEYPQTADGSSLNGN